MQIEDTENGPTLIIAKSDFSAYQPPEWVRAFASLCGLEADDSGDAYKIFSGSGSSRRSLDRVKEAMNFFRDAIDIEKRHLR